MFGRWLKLLIFLFIIAGAAAYYISQRADDAEASFDEIEQECQDYLRSMPNTWKADDDIHHHFRCDPGHDLSIWSQRLEYRNQLLQASGAALLAPMLVVVIALLSLLVRWLITGRWKFRL